MDKKALDNVFSELEQEVIYLEEIRLNQLAYRNKIWIRGIGITILLVILIFFLIPWVKLAATLQVLTFVGGLVATRLLSYDVNEEFREDFKSAIINRLIKTHDPDLLYNPAGHIKLLTFQLTKLFHNDTSNFKGKDLIEGTYKGVSFIMSALDVMTYQVNSENKFEEQGFKGLLLIAEFSKYVHSETFILSKRRYDIDKRIGNVYKGAKLIDLGNKSFADRFNVYSTNPEDAKEIIDTLTMENIVSLENKIKDEIRISVRGQKLAISVRSKKNFFENEITRALDGESLVWKQYEGLSLILGVIDDLNLSKKLWSKVPVKLLSDDEKGI